MILQKEKIEGYVEYILDFLLKTPESPVHKALHQPVPDTDYEYIQMWEEYYKFTLQDRDQYKDLVTNWNSHTDQLNGFEIGHGVWTGVKKLFKKNIEEKIKQMEFTPRLEAYIETLPKEEHEHIKKLLLGLMANLESKRFKDTIIDFGEAIGLSKKWVLTLSEEHPLVKSHILEFTTLSIDEGKPVYEKDVNMNGAVKKIFMGIDVPDTELIQLKDSSLIGLFDLTDPGFFDDLDFDESSNRQTFFEKFDIEEDEEDIDVEQFFSQLESEEIEKEVKLTEEISGKETPDEDHKSSNADSSDAAPYKTDLDYLHQEYLWLRSKFELFKMQNDEIRFIPENDERKINALKQETKKLKNLCELRLKKSMQKGFTPRLISLRNKLKLSEVEVDALKIIVTSELFIPTNSYNVGKNSVGEILALLFENEKERVRAKKLFLKKSKLVRSSLLQIESSGYGQNLFNCTIEIDNRLIEHLVGEDYDISNYLDGGHLYDPSVTTTDVILTEEQKKELLLKVENYPTFIKTKRKVGMPSHIEYGDAQVNLFVGPSGTGKTMLANALANHLGKKILVFNLNNYSNVDYYSGSDKAIFSLLFREARMNDAVLFFDEAEGLLSNRINDLLLELENHHGIVIFATNASFVVDEALRRRINHIVEFKEPGPQLRKKIWENHLPKKIKISEDVDLDKIALRYEINGGLIKNAVFAAVANAVAHSDSDDIVLKMEHLEKGADEQLKNKLFMSKMEKQVTPKKAFSDLVLPKGTQRELQNIANIGKSRKVLVGEWGFKDVFHNLTGLVTLFHGPPGTGKTLAAEALAYETGKNLKKVNYSEVMSKWVGETEKALEALMQEVAESDSILLFDEADGLFASRTSVSTVNDRHANMITNVLLSLTENFNSIAVLTTNFLENIDPAFYRRMELVEFSMPNRELRRMLWDKLIPVGMPVSDDLDLDLLAEKYTFSGGDIKNAVINAASSKAWKPEEHRIVEMADFVEACEKIDRQKRNGQHDIGFN